MNPSLIKNNSIQIKMHFNNPRSQYYIRLPPILRTHKTTNLLSVEHNLLQASAAATFFVNSQKNLLLFTNLVKRTAKDNFVRYKFYSFLLRGLPICTNCDYAFNSLELLIVTVHVTCSCTKTQGTFCFFTKTIIGPILLTIIVISWY